MTTKVTPALIAGGPAFSAYAGAAQSLSNAVFTKVSANTEEFDTASVYDAVTNFRFTPSVSGYYQISGSVSFASATAGAIASIYKNGSEFKRGSVSGSAASSGQAAVVSALVYFNGTTDYVELFAHQNSGGALNTTAGAAYTYFQGCLARPA